MSCGKRNPLVVRFTSPPGSKEPSNLKRQNPPRHSLAGCPPLGFVFGCRSARLAAHEAHLGRRRPQLRLHELVPQQGLGLKPHFS
eukprot:scaffold51004_cov61-Phaeocystis_antarctica.AAC.13